MPGWLVIRRAPAGRVRIVEVDARANRRNATHRSPSTFPVVLGSFIFGSLMACWSLPSWSAPPDLHCRIEPAGGVDVRDRYEVLERALPGSTDWQRTPQGLLKRRTFGMD